MADFSACQKDSLDGKHSNGKVGNHREKDWTDKALVGDKYVRKCFVCDSENHLVAKCPQNPNQKKSKFEKIPITRSDLCNTVSDSIKELREESLNCCNCLLHN